MKLRVTILLLFLTVITSTSCRTEESELIQNPEDETLDPNSIVAQLIQRTTANDGSNDNIIDRANCFDLKFPYSVNVNDEIITINSSLDFDVVECVFDQSEDDVDTLDIMYPVNIILSDFSEITINNTSELNSYNANCNGENVADNDIECLDFQYPITTSTFNSNSELLETLTLESDNQLYDFIDSIDANDIITIDFPITVILADASELSINNFNELQSVIENAINTCDEDDDYDYNEDDCDDCTKAEVENLLTGCNDWIVNTLRRDNGTNYDNLYYNYTFNFFSDGTMSVSWNTTTVTGTWIASGSSNDIEVVIDVPSLPLCNNNWILREVKNCSEETEVDLRVGIDRIQYSRNCN